MNILDAAVCGVVARDPELQQSKSGKPYLVLDIGEADDGNDASLLVLAFSETAEHIAATVRKGDKVRAQGKARLETWVRTDGAMRATLSIMATKVEKVGVGEIGRSIAGRTRPH